MSNIIPWVHCSLPAYYCSKCDNHAFGLARKGDNLIAICLECDTLIQQLACACCLHNNDDKSPCEHESADLQNGIITACKGDINKPLLCKHCGEYYR